MWLTLFVDGRNDNVANVYETKVYVFISYKAKSSRLTEITITTMIQYIP